MTGNEYLQFMTEKFTGFITTPKEKREKERQERHEKRSLDKTDWFGNVPFYITTMIKKRSR